MNKLFTKVVGLCLGLTMAVGVGTAVAFNGVHKEAVEAKAATTWTRITSVDDLVSGTYIIGYESTAGSGTLVPLRSDSANATTTANGYFYTGTTSGSSGSGTISMSTIGDSGSAYEVTVTLISGGVINIQNKDGNYYGATSEGKSKNTARLYTSGNSNETNLTATLNGGKFCLTAGVSDQYKYMKYNTGSPRYAFYNSSAYDTSFYKKESGSSKTLTSISVGGSMSKTDYNTAESWDPSGLTVTAHYDDESTLDVTNGAEWEFDPSAPAVGVTSVTATATYEGKTADSDPQTVTVTEYVADLYEKIISAPSDWSGEYLLVYEPSASTARVWTGVDAVSCYVETSIVDSQIAKPLGSVSLTIASMTGGYSIKINGGDNDGKYITHSANSNGLSIGDTKTAMTPSYVSDSSSTSVANAGGAVLRYNDTSNQNRFRFYKDGGGTQKLVQLYKKVEAYTIANFVSDWNTATNAACSNPDADNTDAITAAWPGIKTNYLKLSAADQATVAAGGDPTPASLIERYDHIVERYDLENFMERSVASSPRINVLNTMNDNGSIAIIVVVSLLSVTAIGGYFFIRRRKEN
ncbi:MAG: hypothetical protein MJ221_01895 [Bacilli bacterium]|nr:hypothetical protein [Bacilli bacterium]